MNDLNYYVLAVFAPLLLVTGIAGFLIPPSKSLTSGAAPYNLLHIIFGLLGIGLVVGNCAGWFRVFNIGFGLIDLYQLAASRLHFFPEQHFKWKKTDDILHLVIGLFLVLVGLFG